MKFLFLGILIIFASSSCTQKTSSDTNSNSPANASVSSADALAAKGKKVFAQNCIACHNPNPKIDGAVGPAIAGSSLELITARVMHASYPPGYKPKRPSAQMPPLPALESEIPALHAFLNQP